MTGQPGRLTAPLTPPGRAIAQHSARTGPTRGHEPDMRRLSPAITVTPRPTSGTTTTRESRLASPATQASLLIIAGNRDGCPLPDGPATRPTGSMVRWVRVVGCWPGCGGTGRVVALQRALPGGECPRHGLGPWVEASPSGDLGTLCSAARVQPKPVGGDPRQTSLLVGDDGRGHSLFEKKCARYSMLRLRTPGIHCPVAP